jgi:hypothetical protein
LPGAHATLGSIAAHRGEWLDAAAHFERAYALDDQTGRIHARHAQTVLISMGRIDEALREFRAEARLGPAHSRGAMQVAETLAIHAGHDAEVNQYLEIAFSLGWPADERDVRELYARGARRAGRMVEAASHQVLALPEAIRARDGATLVPVLHEALLSAGRRGQALRGLDELDTSLRAAGAQTFASQMFLITWYAMLGDLDRAYVAADGWVALTRSSGMSGIPHNAGFWLDEMRAFRADNRFDDLVERLGLTGHWRRFGVADGCRLGLLVSCGGQPGG